LHYVLSGTSSSTDFEELRYTFNYSANAAFREGIDYSLVCDIINVASPVPVLADGVQECFAKASSGSSTSQFLPD